MIGVENHYAVLRSLPVPGQPSPALALCGTFKEAMSFRRFLLKHNRQVGAGVQYPIFYQGVQVYPRKKSEATK